MAVPSYSSDLINITTAESGTWTELTGYALGGAPAVNDTDYFIQGTGCTTAAQSGKTGLQSIAFQGTDISGSMSAGYCVFFWQVMLAGNATDTFANGGLRVAIGDSVSVFNVWYTGGRDFARNPYGGWQNVAVDPTFTPDSSSGTPTTYTFFASCLNMASSISKGNLHGVDAIRYGRGKITVTNGSLADGYAVFEGASTGIANSNDNQTNRWGLFQKEGTGYLWKGLLNIGSAISACEFVDSNKNMTVDNTPRTYSAFNKIEIYNTNTKVTWVNINFTALSPTQLSRGDFEMVANANTVSFSSCSFTDMNTFIFQSNAVLTSCTFRRCSTVTQGGAAFDNCIFDDATNSSAIVSSNPSNISGCTFESDGSSHAIELTAACAGNTYSLSGHTFTGYATSNGTTGNEVIYNNSGGAVTLNVSDITGTVSVRNSTGSTTTVQSSISITINVTDESNTDLQTAYVYIIDDGSTEVMNTTTNVSGVATGTYSGSQSSGTIRVRKYGYKPYTASVGLTSTVNQTVVLVSDPVQDASPQDLSSYFTISTAASTITHSSGTSTYTVKEFFKWLANTFAATSYMQYTYPMAADTATVFRFTNSWNFGAPTTDYHYLTGGAITSSDNNSLWSNVFTLGSIVSGTTLDIYQNDSQITPWWSSGQIDVLVLVKSSGSLIDSGYLTVLARKYSTLYDHYQVDVSGGGRTPVPLAAFTDSNNQTIEGTVGASPYTNITITFGYTSQDLGNGFGSQPYDVSINCAGLTIKQTYEYLKYVTRTGSSATFFSGSELTVNGEFYQGVGDIRFDYDNEGGGGTAFSEGEKVYVSSSVYGYLTSLYDAGTTGTMVLRNVHGTFSDNDVITGNTSGRTASVNGTITTINPSKQAPFGTFAGGQLYGARGVYVYNMAAIDANNYQLIDSTGTTQSPPNTVATTITVQDLSTGSVIEGANVLVWVTDNSNYFYQAAVSITGSGTTATVTHTAHGLTTGDYVIIKGVTNDDDYNGVFEVTVSNENQYTYTATESLDASPATGASITSSFAIISGLTNSSGVVSDTRSLSANQPVSGWARRSSEDSPYYYQQGTISGTIDSDSGLSITLQLARDE